MQKSIKQNNPMKGEVWTMTSSEFTPQVKILLWTKHKPISSNFLTDLNKQDESDGQHLGNQATNRDNIHV